MRSDARQLARGICALTLRAVAGATLTALAAATQSRFAARPVALVTAETVNELVAVDAASGRILARVRLPLDPEYVAVQGSNVVVASGRADAVSLLDWPSLRLRSVLRGFGAPHVVAFAPDGRWAYVTDDARGELDAIDLASRRVASRLVVGALAHHFTLSPDGRRAWVALSETATTIVVADVADPARPSVLGSFDPGFAVHDLGFAPDGRRVWATGATTPQVGVFEATTSRLLFRVPAGPGPSTSPSRAATPT